MFDSYEEIFAARAASYQAAMSRWPDARDSEFQALIEPLGVLRGALCDMPAGGGYLRRYLPDTIDYVAIEPSALFFASCPSGPGNRAIQAPVENVPCADASFDQVVSLAGMHHAPDMAAVFREMRRLVRPAGLVVIADVADGTAPADFLNIYVDAHNPLGHRGTFFDGRTAALLRAAMLEPIDDRLVTLPWCFDDARQAGDYCSSLFGIEGVAPDTVGAVMLEQLGTCAGAGAFNVAWSLRRIVCRPI